MVLLINFFIFWVLLSRSSLIFSYPFHSKERHSDPYIPLTMCTLQDGGQPPGPAKLQRQRDEPQRAEGVAAELLQHQGLHTTVQLHQQIDRCNSNNYNYNYYNYNYNISSRGFTPQYSYTNR